MGSFRDYRRLLRLFIPYDGITPKKNHRRCSGSNGFTRDFRHDAEVTFSENSRTHLAGNLDEAWTDSAVYFAARGLHALFLLRETIDEPLFDSAIFLVNEKKGEKVRSIFPAHNRIVES